MSTKLYKLIDDLAFKVGESFNSYEELKERMDEHTKKSFVYYWRRDSRTVAGAHMKTSRPISKRLKYYSVRYACVHGGQKFLARGVGRRHTQTIRNNCPAYVMLRASKCGQKLEVVSVCNEHNHEISENISKKLPHNRKLPPLIKAEILEMLCLQIDRKKLIEYIKLKTNKQLTQKDLFNLAASHKYQKTAVNNERANILLEKIQKFIKDNSQATLEKIPMPTDVVNIQDAKELYLTSNENWNAVYLKLPSPKIGAYEDLNAKESLLKLPENECIITDTGPDDASSVYYHGFMDNFSKLNNMDNIVTDNSTEDDINKDNIEDIIVYSDEIIIKEEECDNEYTLNENPQFNDTFLEKQVVDELQEYNFIVEETTDDDPLLNNNTDVDERNTNFYYNQNNDIFLPDITNNNLENAQQTINNNNIVKKKKLQSKKYLQTIKHYRCFNCVKNFQLINMHINVMRKKKLKLIEEIKILKIKKKKLLTNIRNH